MLVNKAAIISVFVNLKTLFHKAFESKTGDWEKTAMKVPSTGKQNDYAWISRFPKLREWIGDKVVKSLKAHKYTIVNKSFESTVGVDRDDIEDDDLGLYTAMTQEAGQSAKEWPDDLVNDLKNNAFTQRCYDGQYFYDTDHPVGKQGEEVSVSNKGTMALSCSTKAAAMASYGAARIAITSLKDEEGQPLKLIPDVLEVPPALEAVAKTLCYADKLDDNSPNPYKGTAEVLVNPGLTSSTAWYLHVTNRALMPYIFQERKPAQFVSQTDISSDNVFMRKEFKFGAEARGNGGYGLWQLSWASTGTT